MSRPRTQIGHGVYAWARRERCKCEPCLTAVSRYAKRARLDRERGVARRPPADEVREHANWLLDLGLQRHQISAAAGISDTVLRNILGQRPDSPPAEWVLRTTADKVLSVTYEQAAAVPTYVPIVGVRRRIEALEYLGHPKSVIGERLGVTESQVFSYLKGERARTTTVAAIDKVYRELRTEEGTSERIKWKARRLNFLPPMCWDDEELDDPAATPYPARCAVESCGRRAVKMSLCTWHHEVLRRTKSLDNPRRYVAGVKRMARRGSDSAKSLADALDLKERGLTAAETARQLNLTEDYIVKLWKEAA